MQLSLTILASAFLSAVVGRELSVIKKDANAVVVKSKSGGDTLWFTLSLVNGVPTFEIKGNQKDDEITAKAQVQLGLAAVSDKDAKTGQSLTGTAGYWSALLVEEVGDGKKPSQIVLRSTMVHGEQKDLAGNAFTIVLDAVIDANSEAFTVRPMIQNYPYSSTGSKGRLTFDQVVGSSIKVDTKAGSNGEITLGAYGSLEIQTDSAIEDGEPGNIRAPKLEDNKSSHTKGLAGSESAKHAVIEFSSIRPKNATFVEKLTFHPQALSLPIPNADKPEPKVQAQSKNAAQLSASSVGAGVGVAVLTLVLLLV
jgi:hypothetical protein